MIWEILLIPRRATDRRWVLRSMIAAIPLLSIHSVQADVTDATALDFLRVEKTKAAVMVLQVKTEFLPGSPEYTIARQKYTAAQQAFNNYTKAMLGNYALGVKTDLSASAQLAYSKATDFQAYVSTLDFKHKGFTAVFVAAGLLIDIGDKLYSAFRKKQKEELSATAREYSLQVTWDDWDKL